MSIRIGRQWLGRLLKALLTAGILAVIAARVDLKHALATLGNTDLLVFGVVLGAHFVNTGVAAFRCKLLCDAFEVPDARPGRLYQYYLLSGVLAHIVPASIGGDVARALGLGRNGRNIAKGIALVIVERVSSLVFLALWVIVPVGFNIHGCRAIPALNWLALCVALLMAAAGIAALFAAAFKGRVTLDWLKRFPNLHKIADAGGDIRACIGRLLGNAKVLAGVLFCAWLNVTLASTLILGFVFALGRAPGWLDAMIAGAAVQLISFLPVTIGDLGLREGATIVVLGAVGVADYTATAAAILARLGGVLLAVLSLPWALRALRDLYARGRAREDAHR